MSGYVIRRVAAMPALLLAVVTVTFLITRLIPASPLTSILGPRALTDPDSVAAAKAHWGLDGPLTGQYWRYLVNMAHGDFGTSFVTKNNVGTDLAARLPATLELMAAAIVIAAVGGIGIGVLVATRQNKLTDHVGRFFALVGSSTPVFWSGLVLLLFLSTRWHLFPGPGRLDSRSLPPPRYTGFFVADTLLAGDFSLCWQAIRHLMLPAFVLGWGVMGTVSRIVRASMLDVLNQDYIRTARAKGVREPVVVLKHALRNALLPALTIVGFSVAYLITGAVLVEQIFSWPGIGSYAVTAAESLDFPAIMGVTILGGAAFLIASLVTDLAYAVADPQIRLS
jgi:ABC-type dipeptide/oligopeptide/nickel transport system permease component